ANGVSREHPRRTVLCRQGPPLAPANKTRQASHRDRWLCQHNHDRRWLSTKSLDRDSNEDRRNRPIFALGSSLRRTPRSRIKQGMRGNRMCVSGFRSANLAAQISGRAHAALLFEVPLLSSTRGDYALLLKVPVQGALSLATYRNQSRSRCGDQFLRPKIVGNIRRYTG